MDNKILSFIKNKNLLQKGDFVIVALSGGADSMALFHFLLANKALLGITISAAHVNHNLRKESAIEAHAVIQLCQSKGVELFLKELTPDGNTSEDWARKERYAFFQQLANGQGAKIATAHTASDNAETLIFRLCRGTSLHGACGIPAVRQCFIRPMLTVCRHETENYCHENNIEYFIDKTNLTNQYARGRVRNSVMPQLNAVHSNAEQAIVRFIASACEAQEYINIQAKQLLKDNTDELLQTTLQNIHPAVQKAALSLWLASYCEINELIVNNSCSLIYKKSGRVNLQNNLALQCAKGKIYVTSQQIEKIFTKETPLKQGEINFDHGKSINIKVIEYENFINYQKVQKKSLIFSADYGKIPVDATFRTRSEGDRFTQQGRGVTKTLKKLFIEDGIKQHLRNNLPILASQSKVLWLWGYGFCHGLAPTSATEKVLVLTIKEEE